MSQNEGTPVYGVSLIVSIILWHDVSGALLAHQDLKYGSYKAPHVLRMYFTLPVGIQAIGRHQGQRHCRAEPFPQIGYDQGLSFLVAFESSPT